MKIAVMGGDGFIGWPTSLHLSDAGHDIHILDNLSRRWIDTELGVQSLTPMDSIQERTRIWHEETGRRDRPDAFWRRTDQTFLEHFFPDWHGLPVVMNMLQYVWLTMPALWHWESIAVLHYQYEKPWEKDHPKADRLRPLIDLWNTFYQGHDIPDLTSLPAPGERA